MLNQKRNKRFSYKPRFQDSEKTASKDDLQTEWSKIKPTTKRSGTTLTSLPALIIMLVALFALIYYLNGYMK